MKSWKSKLGVSVFCVLVFIVLVFALSQTLQQSRDEAYSEGFKKGYVEGLEFRLGKLEQQIKELKK